MSNSLDPDQAQHFVGPDLGPNFLQEVISRRGGRVIRVIRVKQVLTLVYLTLIVIASSSSYLLVLVDLSSGKYQIYQGLIYGKCWVRESSIDPDKTAKNY